MTKVDLEKSAHGTEFSGPREKMRPVEWSDKAGYFQTWEVNGDYYIDIGCRRLERFLFCQNDYSKIVKAMIPALTLPALLETNKLLAKLIATAVNENNKELKEELKEQGSTLQETRKELQKYRTEVLGLRRENLRLKGQL